MSKVLTMGITIMVVSLFMLLTVSLSYGGSGLPCQKWQCQDCGKIWECAKNTCPNRNCKGYGKGRGLPCQKWQCQDCGEIWECAKNTCPNRNCKGYGKGRGLPCQKWQCQDCGEIWECAKNTCPNRNCKGYGKGRGLPCQKWQCQDCGEIWECAKNTCPNRNCKGYGKGRGLPCQKWQCQDCGKIWECAKNKCPVPTCVALPPFEEEKSVCSIPFTALEGETAINTKYTGKITSIKFTAVDGKELTSEDVPGVKVKERDGWTILDIPKGIVIVGGIITGVDRIIKILSPKEKTEVTTTPPKDKIIPTDGEIEVTNGNIDETITGEDIFDITKPGENIVSIVKPETNGEYPIDIIAARMDEIKVVGTDIPLDVIGPEGICKVKVTKPDAPSISSDVPSWGYNLSMPPVTQTGMPVPITAYVCGVKGKKVEFKFIPEEGQTIEPLMVTLSTEELGKPIPIAKLTTTKIGPQTLNCEVVIIK
ncbi:MAG: hypothetical protein AB1422_11180 [bacterium]